MRDCEGIHLRRENANTFQYDVRVIAPQRNLSRILPFPFCRIKLKAQKPPKDWYIKALYRQQMRTIGATIKQKRLKLGMLQAALAKRLNIRVVNIQNWEHSRTIPAVYHLPKLIEFLGYDPLESGKKAD